jgi:hypothetical protein
LQKAEAAALIKTAGGTTAQFELLLQQLASQRAGGHHNQIIDPQGIGRKGLRRGSRKHQIGSRIPMGPPELPPKTPLPTPEAGALCQTKPLLPEGRWGLGGLGYEALKQGCIGQQPIQTAGSRPREQQQQHTRQRDQTCRGEGREPEGEILQTHAGTAP